MVRCASYYGYELYGDLGCERLSLFSLFSVFLLLLLGTRYFYKQRFVSAYKLTFWPHILLKYCLFCDCPEHDFMILINFNRT